MKRATLESYPEAIQKIVKYCDTLTKDIQGIKRLPDGCACFDSEWTRINHCQGWFSERYICNEWVTVIRSYNTIVAFLYGDTLYSLGRYSNTTYQHIRKFRNNYTYGGYSTHEVNLKLVDWF